MLSAEPVWDFPSLCPLRRPPLQQLSEVVEPPAGCVKDGLRRHSESSKNSEGALNIPGEVRGHSAGRQRRRRVQKRPGRRNSGQKTTTGPQRSLHAGLGVREKSRMPLSSRAGIAGCLVLLLSLEEDRKGQGLGWEGKAGLNWEAHACEVQTPRRCAGSCPDHRDKVNSAVKQVL